MNMHGVVSVHKCYACHVHYIAGLYVQGGFAAQDGGYLERFEVYGYHQRKELVCVHII